MVREHEACEHSSEGTYGDSYGILSDFAINSFQAGLKIPAGSVCVSSLDVARDDQINHFTLSIKMLWFWPLKVRLYLRFDNKKGLLVCRPFQRF